MDVSTERSDRRRFSFAQLLLLVPWVALVIDAWAPIRDNSFLWHVRAGSVQLEMGTVLTVDPFSFTRLGTEWRTQSWLAELVYAWGESLWDLGFVPVMMLITTSLTMAGIGLISYSRSRSTTTTSLVVVLSLVLMISFMVPRPVIFSFLLFVLVVVGWERSETRWTLPFLFWIWASVHGSFILGLVYVFLTWLGKRERRALAAIFVSGLATLVTAHGWGVVQMLLDFNEARPYLSLLTEWRRPEWLSPVFLPFLLGLVVISSGLWRRRLSPVAALSVVPFALLGFTATRAVPPAWIALVPAIAAALPTMSRLNRRVFAKGPGIAFLALVAILPFLIRDDGALDSERFPVEAAEALDEVNTLSDDRTGGYLIWALGPEFKVFLDDRAELYDERITEFLDMRRGDIDLLPIMERDDIQQAILRTSSNLVDSLDQLAWKTVYSDDEYVVMRP